MKTLVFGKTGQVATELARLLPDAQFLGRDQADLSDPTACAAVIAAADCDVVINAAAYTAVDKAEQEEDLATVINGEAPGAMARACAAKSLSFLHISTDYVFDGSGKSPWKPNDATAPLGAYGRSKLAGETAVIAAGGIHAILRTSWVVSAHGANFVKTMLRLGAERDSLNIVADQWGGPTPAADIAAALVTMARGFHDKKGRTGTYHFSGAPDTNWAGFARAIFETAGISCQVNDIPASDYPTPAARPSNSRLDCSSLAANFAIQRPDWNAGLQSILNELKVSI